ncbi:MAG: ABC transporter permease [Planctomycetota bacterium]
MSRLPRQSVGLGQAVPPDKPTSLATVSSLDRVLFPVDWLGRGVIRVWNELADIAGLCIVVLARCVRPGTWRRTVRREFVRQCMHSGVAALPMVALLSALVGVAVVAQVLNLFRLVGQDALIGQFMAFVLVREVAPVLIGLVLVGRSGTAIIADLGTLVLGKQVNTLDAMGVDPILFLVLPRVLGLVVAAMGLTIAFIVGAFFFGFLLAFAVGYDQNSFGSSAAAAASPVSPSVYAAVLTKSALIGLLIGVVCCRRALRIDQSTRLPSALAGGFIWGVVLVFLISALVTVCWEMLL